MYITFDEIMSYKIKVEGLQAENKRLNDKDGLYDEVKELQVENKRLNRVNAELSDKLQAVNDDYNNDHKVHDEYEDGLLAEIKQLQSHVDKYGSLQYDELKVELEDIKKVTYEKAYKEKGEIDKHFIDCLEESTKKHVAENKQLQNHVDKYFERLLSIERISQPVHPE